MTDKMKSFDELRELRLSSEKTNPVESGEVKKKRKSPSHAPTKAIAPAPNLMKMFDRFTVAHVADLLFIGASTASKYRNTGEAPGYVERSAENWLKAEKLEQELVEGEAHVATHEVPGVGQWIDAEKADRDLAAAIEHEKKMEIEARARAAEARLQARMDAANELNPERDDQREQYERELDRQQTAKVHILCVVQVPSDKEEVLERMLSALDLDNTFFRV